MFAPYAIYTILHREKLKKIAEIKEIALLYERKRWVAGRELFNEAQKRGQEMAILYADATECSKLLYWGRLTRIDVDNDGTRYVVADLTPLSRKRTQELVLRSTNAPIATGFIRPDAIVATPSLIEDHAAPNGAQEPSEVGPTTSRKAFTQYWKRTTLNWHDKHDQELTHAGSNQFRARGVQPGGKIFIVGVIDGKVHLGGVLVVDELVGLREARRQFGKQNVWDASDHLVAREPQTFYWDLLVPMNTVRALRFEGDKALVFKTPGILDTQTLRDVRELTLESAAMLQAILDEQKTVKA